EARRRQVRGERLGRGKDRAEIGPARLALGRADAQEMHLAERADLGERHGEPQSARVQVLPQQRFETGLEERGLPARGHRDLLRVDVDREHVVAEVGQADGVREAEVSGPDDGDPRQLALLLVECSLNSYPPATLGADVTMAGMLPVNETAVTG